MSEPKLFLLQTNEPPKEIPESEYGALSYGGPSFDYMRKGIGADMIEHLTVWYQDQRAHLFFDEEGLLKDPKQPVNARATALHANSILKRSGKRGEQVSYNDLNAAPPDPLVLYVALGVLIVGTAYLWTGEIE
jgi:hypothetical protein